MRNIRIPQVFTLIHPFTDQRNNLRSDLVKLYICLKQIIINYEN